MQALLDTSFLYALNDKSDLNHVNSVEFLGTCTALLFLPAPVLPEICYLLDSRLGHGAMRRFLNGLVASDIEILSIGNHDLPRVTEVLTQYADTRLDFVDAVIVSLAERLNITHIFTFDRRDFSIVRPRHCDFFNLRP